MKNPDPRVQMEAKAAGIEFPTRRPHTDLTAAMVLWNEAKRLPKLLKVLQPMFTHIAIVVQKSDDDTLGIAARAQRTGDSVIADEWHGTGDASMPLLVSSVKTQWTFVIAGDEMPNKELIQSLWGAGWWATRENIDGLWIPFHSSIEGIGYEEQHGHLRMFKTELGWPRTMHSRPDAREEGWWPYGYIDHVRSLDEMVQDYLRYLEMSDGNENWVNHNTLMLHNACEGVAAVKGWDFVKAFPWWPKVEEVAFNVG